LATKLKRLRVDEGSLVDKGANQAAEIVLFKRGDDSEEEEKIESIEKLDAKVLTDIGNIVGTDDEAKLVSIQRVLESYLERIKGKEATQKTHNDNPFIPDDDDHDDDDDDDDDDDENKVKGKKNKKDNQIKTKKGSDSMPIEDEVREALDDSVREYLTELEKRADDTNKVEELEAKVAELEKAAEDTGDEEVDIWKGVSPEVKAQFEDLQKKAETAESVAKAEKEMRVSREFIEKAGQYSEIGSVEDVAKMLRQAYDISDESGEKLEETFKAAAAKIEANDQITKELGRSGESASGGDAWDKIEALADKIVEKADDEITQEVAISKVLKTREGKKLYDEYQTERSVN